MELSQIVYSYTQLEMLFDGFDITCPKSMHDKEECFASAKPQWFI